MFQKLIQLYLVIYRFWLKWPEKLRFLLVGGYNTVVSWLIYAAFLWCFGVHATGQESDCLGLVQLALLLSFALSTINSYFTQKFYVFNTRGNYLSEYVKCCCSWGVGYLVNSVGIYVCVLLQFDPYASQAGMLMLIAVLNYILLKHIAFNKTSFFQTVKQLFAHQR